MSIADTIVGGLLAAFGGWSAIWLQSKSILKNRIQEIFAEKKVSACAQAYKHMKNIKASLTQRGNEQTLELIQSHQDWLFDNLLYLPPAFASYWLEVRTRLAELIRHTRAGMKRPEELSQSEIEIDGIIEKAIDEVFKDLNLRRPEVHGLPI